MAANEGEEATVSLVDVLEEDEELEQEASAVLGGSDSEKCSYPEVNILLFFLLRPDNVGVSTQQHPNVCGHSFFQK